MKFNLECFKVWWFGHTLNPISNIDAYIALVHVICFVLLDILLVVAAIRWCVYTYLLSVDTVFFTHMWKIVWNILIVGLLVTLFLLREHG